MPETAEPRDYTPEEITAIYAHFKKKFSVEDLLGYIEDSDPVIPAEESLRQLEEVLHKVDASYHIDMLN